MIKVMFVCLGNICRSPMAEFLLKDMVEKSGMQRDFEIASSGTSSEEYGNPVHPGTKKLLAEKGISVAGKYATQLKREDYIKYDFFLAMEQRNVTSALRIFGGDSENKVVRLLDFTSNPRDIADPWYTGDFQRTYEDIMEGLQCFVEIVSENR